MGRASGVAVVFFGSAVAMVGAGAVLLGACGSDADRAAFEVGSEAGSFTSPTETSQDGCAGFNCGEVVSCSGGAKTILKGTAYDPAAKVPLYNVAVYVPATDEPLPAIQPGASCDRCGATVIHPRASALSDSKGEFTLEVSGPVKDLPLVVQVGKWRRQVRIPDLKPCQENVLPADYTRLPRSQAEGDLPKIGIATGECDPLQCLLRRMGVDDSEFTDDLGKGRIHIFQGKTGGKAKNSTANSAGLWNSVDLLKRYDMVMLSCECDPYARTPQQLEALRQYSALGGRVYATHYSYTWLANGPEEFRSTANWSLERPTPINGNYVVDTSFPKGQAFGQWLVATSSSATFGRINLDQVKGDVLDTNAGKSQRWIYDENPISAKYFSFNTPLDQPADARCGRVVFSDIHVATGDLTGQKEFPDGCEARDLNPQEKALEFLLFDLSACIEPDDRTPVPPR